MLAPDWKIKSTINAFESGSASGNYAALVIMPDGPGRMRQITYGCSQLTEYGKLARLVQSYCAKGGKYASQLGYFCDLIGTQPLCDNHRFKELLRAAGSDPIMMGCQDDLFDAAYYRPALTWCSQHDLLLPLSKLVVYDSFIHSGAILNLLRERFSEKTPANGGDEKAWVQAYVKARHEWLSNHNNSLLHKTKYRTQCLLNIIDDENWDLSEPYLANGVEIK